MYCDKCGTKNKKNSKFCESCGNKLKLNNKNTNFVDNFKMIPKNKKIGMGIAIIIIILAIGILSILLNNPLKIVEDKLGEYYENYSENSKNELVDIGIILKNNKNDKKLLENIKNNTHKEIKKWTKNFNTDYKNQNKLNEAYTKLVNALEDIYDYFDGLEYMLDYDLYTELLKEAKELYNSKKYYLTGKEYEKKSDEYYAYYNYQKVIEGDSYYNKAQEYVNNYLKDKLKNYKEKADEYIKDIDKLTTDAALEAYISHLDYIIYNSITDNADLSVTDDYKRMYENAINKVMYYTKKLVDELEEKNEFDEAISAVKKSLDCLPEDIDDYKELEKLKKELENKLPDSLISKDKEYFTGGIKEINYKKEINDVEYDGTLGFVSEGDTVGVTYKLNKDYKKFKTSIVLSKDWDTNISGYFVIKGDNKELYKSPNISLNSSFERNIELDVLGIDDLKIEFITISESNELPYFYIYLVEPYLYK
ncbi:MAG: hypothetical protein E7163_05385 [Firmicutes bacterium]|nr:hypothetical protein [Bacillota bacterium]